MLTLRTNKIFILLTTLIVVGLFVSILGANVSAQQNLNASQVNDKATEFCGDGPVDSNEGACRNGFRRGYDGETVAQACTNRADYNAAKKAACNRGHAEGRSLKASGGSSGSFFGSSTGTYTCGSGPNAIKTKFNFGCRGQGNPIFDVLFAIIRFLTFGVGIVVTIAIILAGIKYSTSEGNPEATMAAKNQIQNAIIALMIYLFAFALLNFLVPGGLLR